MLLALETAFGIFSIALFDKSELVDSIFSTEINQQAELLLPAIEEILSRNKIWYGELNQIAAGVGPGSFTGLRIGLAAAKGIALAAKIECIGVSSLEASAYKQGGGEVYLDANRNEAYFQKFDSSLNALSEPVLINHNGIFSPLPDAVAVGKFALRGFKNLNLEPLYIRKPDAKIPAKS